MDRQRFGFRAKRDAAKNTGERRERKERRSKTRGFVLSGFKEKDLYSCVLSLDCVSIAAKGITWTLPTL